MEKGVIFFSFSCRLLRKLLLDEKGPQVRELPCASDTKDSKLDKSPADNTGVCGFGLISEFSLAFL